MTWLIALVAHWGIPEPFRKAAAWATIIAAALALLWAGKAIYDAAVIADHEKDKAVESIDARDKAAEQRADDAIANAVKEKEAQDAIKNVDPADAQLALDCLRLERIGSVPEPCRRFSSDGNKAGSD